MRIFITGGAGLIGTALAGELLNNNNDVFVYDNLIAGKKTFLPKSNRLIFKKGDIRDKKLLKRTLLKFSPEIIIHLAAIHFIPLCDKYPAEALDVNVLGTKNVFDSAAGLPRLKKILIASSAAVYGPSSLAHAEEEKCDPCGVYSTTKYVNELQAKEFFNGSRVDTIVMRIFNVYGKNEVHPHLIPRIVDQLRIGDGITLGNTKTRRAYINSRDVAKGMSGLAKSNKAKGFRIYNIGSSTEYNAKDIVGFFSSILGRKLSIIKSEQLLRKNDMPHLLPRLTRIKKDLGWETGVSIIDGLSELI